MPTEQRSPVSRRKLGIFGIVRGIGAGAGRITGIQAREESGAKLKEWTDEQAIPTVAVAPPNAQALNPTIDLPGRLEAYSRAPIFARVTGYLKSWNADIGAQVKAGQVLAEIEAPDLDQQLLQARADLASQQSSARAVGSDAEPPQDAARLELRLAAGDRRAHRRSRQQEGGGQFRPGQCRAAGGAGRLQEDRRAVRWRRHRARYRRRRADQCRRRRGPPMFVISDITKLRVYVNVPQTFVPAIKIGAKAVITVPEYPNRTFAATVEASSQSVDVSSGTTRMQLALDNAGAS